MEAPVASQKQQEYVGFAHRDYHVAVEMCCQLTRKPSSNTAPPDARIEKDTYKSSTSDTQATTVSAGVAYVSVPLFSPVPADSFLEVIGLSWPCGDSLDQCIDKPRSATSVKIRVGIPSKEAIQDSQPRVCHSSADGSAC